MLLVIDVGNTDTVVGLFADSELRAHWRISTARERTADEFEFTLRGILEVGGFDVPGSLSAAAIASVVPLATTGLRVALRKMVQGKVLVVEPGVRTGVPILIDNPREVGADRVVNSVAAIEKYGVPVVVVDFGTATTFDVVSAKGEYVGGSIAPGIEVSLDGLIRNTAALRRVELVPPRSVIGKGTVEAIQSGLLFGYAGLVDGIMDRLVAELGGDVKTVATGGLASTIVPYCRSVRDVDEFLTLDGLRLVYERNAET